MHARARACTHLHLHTHTRAQACLHGPRAAQRLPVPNQRPVCGGQPSLCLHRARPLRLGEGGVLSVHADHNLGTKGLARGSSGGAGAGIGVAGEVGGCHVSGWVCVCMCSRVCVAVVVELREKAVFLSGAVSQQWPQRLFLFVMPLHFCRYSYEQELSCYGDRSPLMLSQQVFRRERHS
jgi:hypothetical protein